MPVGETGPFSAPADNSSWEPNREPEPKKTSKPAPPDERHGILAAARQTEGLDRLINEFRRTRGVTPEHTDTLLDLVARFDGYNIPDDLKNDYLTFVKDMPKVVPAKPADMIKFLELGARLLGKERYGCRSIKVFMDVFPNLSDYSNDTFQIFHKIVGRFIFNREWRAKKEDSLQYARLHSVQGDLDKVSYDIWGPFQDGWLRHKKEAAEIASKAGEKIIAGGYFVEAANAARQMYLDETIDQGNNQTMRGMAENWIDMYLASAKVTSDITRYNHILHTIYSYFAAGEAAKTIIPREIRREMNPRVDIVNTREIGRNAYRQCLELASILKNNKPIYYSSRINFVVSISHKMQRQL
jgi:hypothetical protein